jgi:predicted enzyme involved in methoxymalonyl-ACP biosynthesis
MNLVVDEARRRGLHRVRGEFIPTPKNAMVREFFSRFGFEKTREESDGRAEWILDADAYSNRAVYIQPADVTGSVPGGKEMQTT